MFALIYLFLDYAYGRPEQFYFCQIILIYLLCVCVLGVGISEHFVESHLVEGNLGINLDFKRGGTHLYPLSHLTATVLTTM